ncbi:MAG TPA: glutamyl-tRNA reductase [Gammaproteobacteria bacterium]|nr:glutamyl-tRNA reductase [Gammaproteobacteria bacterium]
MPFFAVGINHKTAPVEVRERVAFAPETVPSALQALTACPAVHEAALLSTCNRTEIYCSIDGTDCTPVIEWLCQYHRLNSAEVEPFVYIHTDQAAINHVLRVASGLDSMILGEPQILGQMKAAYKVASEAGTVGMLLGRLFQHTFLVAKQVRTDTAIGASPVSVAFAAVSLAKQIFGDLTGHTALLIGAGETIELTARHLHESNIGRIIVANRTVERAHALASEFNGYAISLSEMPAHLAEADIVISSTASQLPILGKGSVESALKVRKHRPIFMVDIAVPRDIEPEVSELPDVYLYTVDDLQEVIQENLKSRQAAAKQAEEIVDVQVTNFMGWLQSLNAVSTIRAYRSHAEHTRDNELENAKRLLAQGRDPEQVMHLLARALTNKLIHTPSIQMKQAGFEGRLELLQAARELFDLKDES